MINVLTLTATEAASQLDAGTLTSVDLVTAYLSQIEKHNHKGLHLNAIISLVSRQKTLSTAQTLDQERKAGHKRSPLHGIPFVFKDVFVAADLGIPCTAGAPALLSAKPRRTAPLIRHLLDIGMICLGTTNLTELCGMKTETITPGWSPVGGQTQSPYIFGGLKKDDGFVGHSSPGGSSSGSAVAVAAGFAPLAIGTECCGSLVLPSTRNAVYNLKCGLGMVEVEGSLHYSDNTDFVGVMGKSAQDVAALGAVVMQRSGPFEVGSGLSGLSVGFVDSRKWQMSEAMCKASESDREQMDKAFEEAKKRFADAGAQVIEDIDVPHPSDGDRFQWKGKSIFYEVTRYQMRTTFPEFFAEFKTSEIRSVTDMIKWNVDHADIALPEETRHQNQFYDLLYSVSKEEHDEIRKAFHREGDDLLKVLDTVDVVVSYGESSMCMYTSAAGLPTAHAPLGVVKYSAENERPFGLSFQAKQGGEELLMRVIAAFEELYPERPIPRPLLESKGIQWQD